MGGAVIKWNILNNGTTIERVELPVTIPADPYGTYTDITASNSLTISNIGLGNTASVEVDGTTLVNGMKCNYRDCIVGLSSYLPDGRSGSDINMTYFTDGYYAFTEFLKLDKDGTVIDSVDQWEEYIATAPDNFLVYDHGHDNITLKAGTYDASIDENFIDMFGEKVPLGDIENYEIKNTDLSVSRYSVYNKIKFNTNLK